MSFKRLRPERNPKCVVKKSALAGDGGHVTVCVCADAEATDRQKDRQTDRHEAINSVCPQGALSHTHIPEAPDVTRPHSVGRIAGRERDRDRDRDRDRGETEKCHAQTGSFGVAILR